jgi:hypothetical protein
MGKKREVREVRRVAVAISKAVDTAIRAGEAARRAHEAMLLLSRGRAGQDREADEEAGRG